MEPEKAYQRTVAKNFFSVFQQRKYNGWTMQTKSSSLRSSLCMLIFRKYLTIMSVLLIYSVFLKIDISSILNPLSVRRLWLIVSYKIHYQGVGNAITEYNQDDILGFQNKTEMLNCVICFILQITWLFFYLQIPTPHT